MATIFDGKKFASQKEEELKALGRHPKLVSILVGNDPASKLYVMLKKKFAERVGAILEIKEFDRASADEIENYIKSVNTDGSVNGVMIQLPLPENLKDDTQKLIDAIDPKKDVDGLRSDSPYLHPTSKAVVQIIKESERLGGIVCVVGATGMVGRPLVNDLKKKGYDVIECDSKTLNLNKETLKADIIVSATGVPKIIKEDMVREGAVVIDVGSPKGDVDFEGVSKRAGFITPVPGGVGPVTISCLLENLMQSVSVDS